MFRAFVLASLVLVPLTTLPSAAAVPAEFAGRGCSFWNTEDGSGPEVKVDVQKTDNNGQSYYLFVAKIHPDRDNRIASLRCDRHCNTALYDQPNRAGGEIFVADGQAGFVSLRGNAANKRTSSLAVFCAR